MSKSSGLADAAQTGFAAAAAYDQHRPTYPPKAVDELISRLELSGVEGAKVLEIAAGTGKFTELLAARPEKFEILAVEPHDGMRGELQRKELDRITVEKGTADSMPEVSDESVQAVIAAQSFHWFANMKALKEFYRVLQPRGTLGLVWNIEDYNAPMSWEMHSAWEKKIRELIWSFDDNMPRFRHEKWRKVFDDQNQDSLFSLTTSETLFGLPLGEDVVKFETWLPKDDIWKRIHTLSQIAVLEGEDLEQVKKTFWSAIDAEETVVDDKGRVAVHGQTFIVWTSKIPSVPLRSGG